MQEELLIYYQKYKLYIFPAVAAFSALILIVFVIYPQTLNLLTNQKATSEIIKKIDLFQTKVEALESYDEKDLKNKIDVVTFSYPVDKDLGVILGLLQEITSKSGFSISSLSLGGSGEKNTGVQSYVIKLDAIGTLSLLPNLFKNMESSSRLLRISSIDTTIGKDETLTVSLAIEAIYSGVPGNFGSIDSTLPEISSDEEEILAQLTKLSPVSSDNTSLTQRGKSNPFE